jgi:hypothetical protein
MRRYKTVIELVCEAEDRHEALDLAGEYLRGSLASGVEMRYRTKPLNCVPKILTTLCVAGVITGVVLSRGFNHQDRFAGRELTEFNACQIPLKTHVEGRAQEEFKSSWQRVGSSCVLEQIKK